MLDIDTTIAPSASARPDVRFVLAGGRTGHLAAMRSLPSEAGRLAYTSAEGHAAGMVHGVQNAASKVGVSTSAVYRAICGAGGKAV